jgi:hypothetical protein
MTWIPKLLQALAEPRGSLKNQPRYGWTLDRLHTPGAPEGGPKVWRRPVKSWGSNGGSSRHPHMRVCPNRSVQ